MDNVYLKNEIINNEFDYSNIIPTVEAVSYLVQFCDQMNKQLIKLVEEDEEKIFSLKMSIEIICIRKVMVNNLKYISRKEHIIILLAMIMSHLCLQ